MKHHCRMAVSVGFLCAALTARLVRAQEGKATVPLEPDRRSADTVWGAARREAEAKKKEMEANFARIRGIPVARPAAPPAMPLVAVQGDVVVRLGLQAQVRVEPDADAPFEEEPPPPTFIADDGLVDRVIFISRSRDWILARFEALLASEVERAGQKWGLTPAQKEKIRLAGRGDMTRFFDRVDAKRREFAIVRVDREKSQQLVRELLQLRNTAMSGPFGEGSIFLKVLGRIIDERRAAER